MATTNLGKVSVTPKGAWSNATAYERLDIVTNGGNGYIALQDVPSGTAISNTSYWLKFADKGDKGNTGEITGASASISGGYGSPTVSVTSGGTSTDRSFAFAFANLKGNGITGIALLSTSGSVKTYRISMDDGSHFDFDVTDGEVTEAALEEILENYATINGYFEQLTAGRADNLVSNVGSTDPTPYNFRTVGGMLEVGDTKKVEKYVGYDIAWNQLVKNGNFADTSNWDAVYSSFSVSNNVASFTASAQYGRIKQTIGDTLNGHIYMYTLDYKGVTSGHDLRVNFTTTGKSKLLPITTEWQRYVNIATFNHTGEDIMLQDPRTGNWDAISVRNVMFVDLTLTFGSAIANYVYSLETAEAGTGVQWLKGYGFFTKPYYAYNAGSLQAVQLGTAESVEVNQWDEQSRNGYYDVANNGVYVSSELWKCTQNLIPCVPNTNYYFYADYAGTSSFGALIFYDASGNQISYRTSGVKNAVFQTPSNCYYMAFYAKPGWFDSDICINIHWDGENDGLYFPYKKHTYALPQETLHGVLTVDAYGHISADGDTLEPDGTLTHKYGIVDLGTLNWGYQSAYNLWASADIASLVDKSVPQADIQPLRAEKYVTVSFNTKTDSIILDTTTPNRVTQNPVYGNLLVNTGDGTTSPSGYLVYELATPTTEQVETYTETQIVHNCGTESITDYAYEQNTRDVEIPVGHETFYPINIKAKVETAPDSPNGNGYYAMMQDSGTNEYVPIANVPVISGLVDRNPVASGADGTYVFKATIVDGTPTYAWVLES